MHLASLVVPALVLLHFASASVASAVGRVALVLSNSTDAHIGAPAESRERIPSTHDLGALRRIGVAVTALHVPKARPSAARHSGTPDPQRRSPSSASTATAWAPDPADHRRRVRPAARLLVPGRPPAGEPSAHRVGVGQDPQPPPRQVLLSDSHRAAPPGRRRGSLGTPRRRHGGRLPLHIGRAVNFAPSAEVPRLWRPAVPKGQHDDLPAPRRRVPGHGRPGCVAEGKPAPGARLDFPRGGSIAHATGST